VCHAKFEEDAYTTSEAQGFKKGAAFRQKLKIKPSVKVFG